MDNLLKSTLSKKKIPLPDYVLDAIDRLKKAGFEAYLVGGSVRDFLLERGLKDHDLATNALPDDLSRLFPEAIEVGKSFGVIKVPIAQETSAPIILEIATFREDLEYQDHRHPEGVVFSTPEKDAQRRDFTINALFYDVKNSKIHDYVGGLADLKAKTLRAIGKPNERFQEDALRLLRAVRFSVALGFHIEKETEAAIHKDAHLISEISGERIRDELTSMWRGENPHHALQKLSNFGLLQRVLPELEELKGVVQSPEHHPEGDVWMHTALVMEKLSKNVKFPSLTLVWSTLLHDIGKPESARRSGGENFHGHETIGAQMTEEIGSRLKLSRKEIDRIKILIAEHLKFKDAQQMKVSTLKRWLLSDHFEELLELHRADTLASSGNLAHYEFCLERLNQVRKEADQGRYDKLLSGNDVMNLGILPGPRVGDVLRAVEDEVLEGNLQNKKEAIDFVKKNFLLKGG
jgi:poly(A) polymerase